MTKDEYELMTFFNKPVKEQAKLIYVGSGEDVDLNMVYQLENPESHEETSTCN